jgi:outer membrane protein assembly factor BamB
VLILDFHAPEGTILEINRLQGNIPAKVDKKEVEKEVAAFNIKDSVSLGGKPRFASLSRASIANQVFNPKKILWSSDGYRGSSSTKGILEGPDGNIIAGTYCDIKQISRNDGKPVWEKDLMKPAIRNLSTSPAVIAKDGSLLIGTTDGNLYSLDPKTGKELWSYKTDAYSTVPVQAQDGTIYVNRNKDLAALNPDGTEKFQAPINRDRQEINYVDQQGAVYVKSDDELFAIGPDGSRRWQAPGHFLIGFSDDGQRLYTTATRSLPHPVHEHSTIFHTLVNARDPKTGEVQWEKEYDYAKIGGFHKGLLFVQEHTNLSAVDAATGKTAWEYPGNTMRDIKAILDDGTIIASSIGKFEALDAGTGKVKWTLESKSAQLSSAAFPTARGSIVIADLDNIYSIDPKDGKVNVTIKMDKGIRDITLSRDESVIYAEESETGAIHAVDFRTAGELAKEIVESAPPPGESQGVVEVVDDYVIIDGIKLPREKK